MAIATRRAAAAAQTRLAVAALKRRIRSYKPFETWRSAMKLKWETPAARDLRFGFEITMYIANR